MFGVACGLRFGRRSGIVLAVVALSHWVLDLIVHRAASQVAREVGVPRGRAASAMVLVAGLVTLALSVAGY